MRHHGPYRIDPLLPVEPQSLPCSQKLEQKFVPYARVPESDTMHKDVAYLLSVRKRRTEPQADHMELDVRNAVGDLLDGDIRTSHIFRKICEREKKDFFHDRSF